MHNPIVFIENEHTGPFENNMQRLRYFENMNLTVPIDIVRFCPGGSHCTIFALVQVGENRDEKTMLTEGGRVLQKLRPQMCRRFNRLFLKWYTKSCLDSSTANHPDATQSFLEHQAWLQIYAI